MIQGNRIRLRPIRDEDWLLFEKWAQDRAALWGQYQRYQLDNLPQLKSAYQQMGLLRREASFFMIETIASHQPVGFIRYTLLEFPDADNRYPEIGYGITESSARGKGYAQEAVQLLLGYLFGGFPTERIAASVDVENAPSRRVLENTGFSLEGVLRCATFYDGRWLDLAVYSILRREWQSR